MKNKRVFTILACQILIAIFLVINIIGALVTKQATLFSYVCCHILGILQSVIIIKTVLREETQNEEQG